MLPFSLRSPMHVHSIRRDACFALAAGALLAGCMAGCSERENAGGGGTVVIGSAQDPKTLFPPVADGVQARALTELLFERLADRGTSLNTVGDSGFVPRLADRWEWSSDSLRVTFHLDPRARWEDGKPVTAEDVRFGFAVYTDTLVGARQGGDLRAVVDSVSVSDSLTCTAWFRQRSPERFDALVTSLTPLPAHLLAGVRRDSLAMSGFARHPVGDGPFKLVKWEQQVRLELAPSDSYHGARPKLDRVIWSFAPDASTLLKQFLAGESDFLEGVTPDDAPAVTGQPQLRLVRLGAYGYNFLQFNLRDGASARPHPIFGDRAVRRALTMALDRGLLVRSVFDTLGRVGLGPFVRAQWAADTSIAQIPFDRAGAARLLDSLGWRAGADGVRARNGKPLAFALLTPTSSKPRLSFAVLIQEQLRLVGVKVDIEKRDYPAMQDRMKKHAFDALMGGLIATPSPSGVRQTWTSAASADGGFNFGTYTNAAFDAQVDSALTATDPRRAKAHYRAAYQIIVDDAPAIWLYEPPNLAGANARLQLGAVRPDAWWMGIPAWSIAPGKRLPRDAAPPGTP
jgi:peptide/nickel transport system substrate-binding protein